ncbi:MAG: translation initiation factor IF-2 N-terminal domain-containing protein, partial [Synechococcaceae cyanobacterium]|nr:translation initiation factor IF-2 N-terminal domain-containing protein [Synechococcaceae cyanobacterium]
MTSGKVRIYELSKELGLENKDVIDAAEKLAIPVRSHSSSIGDDEAVRIRSLLKANGAAAAPPNRPASAPSAILTVRKTPSAPEAPEPPRAKAAPTPQVAAPVGPAGRPAVVSPPVRPSAPLRGAVNPASPQRPQPAPKPPATA